MSNEVDGFASSANAVRTGNKPKGKEQGLKEISLGKLGDQKRTVIGTGKVTRLGFQFFVDEVPQTAWVTPGATPKDVMSALFDRGHYQFDPAYKIAVQVEGDGVHEINLSPYHTQRILGNAPALSLDEEVVIHAARRGNDGVSYVYEKLKGAK